MSGLRIRITALSNSEGEKILKNTTERRQSIFNILYKRRKDIAEVIRNIKIKELIFVIAVMGTLGIVVACIQGAYLGEMTLSIQRMAMIVAVIFLVIIIIILVIPQRL